MQYQNKFNLEHFVMKDTPFNIRILGLVSNKTVNVKKKLRCYNFVK